jgi:Holliday junction DNA helicase RuvA
LWQDLVESEPEDGQLINFLRGQVIETVKTSNQRLMAILEVNQVGYEIQVPSRLASQLLPGSDPVQLFTHLQLREDNTMLFGFASSAERDLFRQLIGVTGIGAQSAISLIDALGLEELIQAIVAGNTHLLSQAPGVGKKTAERIALELKSKLAQWREFNREAPPGGANYPKQEILQDVELTLSALGYSKSEIDRALAFLARGAKLQDSGDAEAWIRQAIAWLSAEG